MGCKSSICDSSELIISQPLAGKLSDVTVAVSEKSTNHSSNILQQKDSGPVRKLLKLKSLIKVTLGDFPNSLSLFKISDIWIQEIIRLVEENKLSDFKLGLSLDSNGRVLVIKTEFDGIRNFEFIISFFQSSKFLLNAELDFNYFHETSDFFLSLCPLTYIFYIKLGNEIDFGIGIEKPVEQKQFSMFLMNCKERSNIIKWINKGIQPIPVGLNCSVFNKTRNLQFYLFDGHRAQNFDKAIELFEEFGAPLNIEWVEYFRKINESDEVYCGVEFDEKGLKRVYLQIKAADVDKEVIGKIDCNFNVSKWCSFLRMAPWSIVALDLSMEGFLVKGISVYN